MVETLECRKCHVSQPPDSFYQKKGKPDLTWCKECYRQWYRGRYTLKDGSDDSPRVCEWCGESYQPMQRRASVYCSRKCKSDDRNDRLARERALSKPTDRECLHCAAVLPQSMRSDAVFCSEWCNSRAHALQRKMRMRTGQDDKPGYLRAAICKRDGWRCGICKERVSPSLEHPNPRCASLDHIIPVSRGGLSEPVNLRLVHLVCNLRRRNLGGVEQLAMFG